MALSNSVTNISNSVTNRCAGAHRLDIQTEPVPSYARQSTGAFVGTLRAIVRSADDLTEIVRKADEIVLKKDDRLQIVRRPDDLQRGTLTHTLCSPAVSSPLLRGRHPRD